MIKVVIERRVQHATYGKTLSRRTKLNVHWEGEQHLIVGDLADIMESRPISRIKHHVFVRKAV
jgi:small subunit ribosomal protein S17